MRLMTGLMLSVLAIAGCRSSNPPMEATAESNAIPQVTVASTALQTSLRVEPPRPVRDEFGILHVTLPVRNTRNTAFTIDYKVTFFDREGSRLSETGWLSLPLEANTPALIQANSPSDRAADFAIAIRRAK